MVSGMTLLGNANMGEADAKAKVKKLRSEHADDFFTPWSRAKAVPANAWVLGFLTAFPRSRCFNAPLDSMKVSTTCKQGITSAAKNKKE